MRIVLLGDSHLARIRRELPRLGDNVVNAAVGGATAADLTAQAAGAVLTTDDVVVVSVGTNDAAPSHHMSVDDFHQTLAAFLTSWRVRSWVIVTPPGVDESRVGAGHRANAEIDAYRKATVAVANEGSARLVDSRVVLRPLGPRALDPDGLHLSGEGYRRLLPALAAAVHLGNTPLRR